MNILKFNSLYPYGLNDRLEKPLYIENEIENLNGAVFINYFLKKSQLYPVEVLKHLLDLMILLMLVKL